MAPALPTVARDPSPPSAEEAVALGASDFIGLARRKAPLIGGCALGAVLLAGVYLALQTPVFRATSQILVDPQALQVVGKDIVRSDTAASIDFANIDSQALVMASTSVLDQLIAQLQLDQDPAFGGGGGLLSKLLGREPQPNRAATLENVRRSIVVRRIDNSLVFELTVSHPDANKAARIANELAAIYLRQGSEGRGAAVKRAAETLMSQLSSLRSQLNDAETAVEKFRSENGLISTGEAGLLVNQQLKDLTAQITTAETEVARLAARKDQLARLGADALLSDRIPEALNSPTITALRTQYAQTAREAARLAETLMPRHPRLIEARGELAASRKLLGDELDRIRASIVEEYGQAQANLAKLKERAASLTESQVTSSEAEIKLRQLESEAEAVRAVYNASLGRAKELEQQQKIETSNSRLISSASPPLRPIKAPASIVLPAAALFGACLGFAIAYLLDLLRGATPNARAAGAMFGVDTVASIRRRSGRQLDERDRAALTGVARRLQECAGALSPGIVVVASTAEVDGAVRRNAVTALGHTLAGIGEDVWICLQGGPDSPLNVERIRPASPTHDEAPFLAAGGRSLSIIGALNERASGRGKDSEFVLATADHFSGLAAFAGVADAIVLIVEPGRTRRRALRELVGQLDPGAQRVAAVIAVEPPAKLAVAKPRLFAWRPRKAVA